GWGAWGAPACRTPPTRAASRWPLFPPAGLDSFLRAQVERFDVAHIHGMRHLPGALAARRLRRARVPYVVQPHGTAPRIERRRALKWLFDATLGRGVLEGARRVIAVSVAEPDGLERLGVASARPALFPNPGGAPPPRAPARPPASRPPPRHAARPAPPRASPPPQ